MILALLCIVSRWNHIIVAGGFVAAKKGLTVSHGMTISRNVEILRDFSQGDIDVFLDRTCYFNLFQVENSISFIH